MGYVNYNPNPENKIVGDCVARAVSIALGLTWDDAHDDLCDLSGVMHDMPSSNNVWGEYVRLYGFKRHIIEDTCREGWHKLLSLFLLEVDNSET